MTVVPAGLGVGALLAHQGGWDEILMVLTPVALFAGLLWLANSRATRLQQQRTTSPAETTTSPAETTDRPEADDRAEADHRPEAEDPAHPSGEG